MKGWDYPKNLAGRVYGLVVHGDVAGIEGSRRGLSDWLDWMGLIDAGSQARLYRFHGALFTRQECGRPNVFRVKRTLLAREKFAVWRQAFKF